MASPSLQEYAIMAGMDQNYTATPPSPLPAKALSLDIAKAVEESEKESEERGVSPVSPSSMFGKSVIEQSRGCIVLTALLSYWDNILGPRIRHQWYVEGEEAGLSADTLTYVASHTLSGEICRNTMDSSIDTVFCVVKDRDLLVHSFVFGALDHGEMAVHSLSLLVRHSNLDAFLAVQELCTEWNKRLVGKLRVLMEKEMNDTMTTCFSGYLTKFVQMLNSLREAGVPKHIPLCDTVFHPEHAVGESLLRRAITSHLITCGRSIIIGKNTAKINVMVATLAMFLSPSERLRCRYASENLHSSVYQPDLLVQGITMGVCGEEALAVSLQDAVLSRYPSTLINLSSSPEASVQVSAPPHLHRPRCHATRRLQLTTLWHGTFSDYPTSDMFHTMEEPDTLVRNFLDELFLLPPTNGLRESYVKQFVALLERKAVSLLKYIKAEIGRERGGGGGGGGGGGRAEAVRGLKHSLALTVPGDFLIVLAAAERLKPGVAELLCGEAVSEADFRGYISALK